MAMLKRPSYEDTEHKLPARAGAMVQLVLGSGTAALVSSGTRGTSSANQAKERPGQTHSGFHQGNPVRFGGNRVEFEQMPANLTPPTRSVEQSQGMPNLAFELTHYSMACGPRGAFVYHAPHGPHTTL